MGKLNDMTRRCDCYIQKSQIEHYKYMQYYNKVIFVNFYAMPVCVQNNRIFRLISCNNMYFAQMPEHHIKNIAQQNIYVAVCIICTSSRSCI